MIIRGYSVVGGYSGFGLGVMMILGRGALSFDGFIRVVSRVRPWWSLGLDLGV